MALVSDVTTTQLSGQNHIDSLLDSGPGWNWLAPTRNIIYYTFSVASGNETGTSSISGGVTAFNATQQSACLNQLAYISQLTGITFSAAADGTSADLHFANTNIVTSSSTSGLCSWGYNYSYDGTNTVTSYTADAYVYLDNAEWLALNTTPLAGNDGYEVLLHELGHALGLKHPFDGATTLPAAQDNTANTVMSYTSSGGPYSTFSPYDEAALLWIYGDDGLGGSLGVATPGKYIVGNTSTNSISGNSGNDKLYGGKGNDTLYGGKGSDTFEVWTSAAYASSSYETSTDTIMDFTTGTDGDTLAIPTGWFTNYSAGSNPFTTGHARLTQSGSDTLLELDMDGTGSGNFQAAMILNSVTKTNLVASNLNGFSPAVILPTYSLTANPTNADEGTSATFTLTTTNVANGTVLPYVLSGTINTSDIAGGSLSGNVTVNNNTATITVGLVADAATEGAEILTASITGTTASATTSVSDTSPSSTTGAPMFTEYNTTTHTTNDLLTHLVSSTSTTGVQFSAANLIGAPAQVSMFESLNLSSTLTMGKGVLLTSGDGTPPESSTSSGYGISKSGLGDAAMTTIALQAFSGAGATHDASILEFTATVTDASVTTLAIDLIFGSDEYPEYADSSYVDIAAAIVNGVNYGLFSNGSPLSITQANNSFNNVTANQGLPIEYDGLSGRLTVLIPVQQGTNLVRLGVADTGDHILDSGLFVSNLRALSGTASTGVKLEIVAPTTGGTVSSSAPTQAIAEIFYGSTFNDVVIAGAGDDYANSSGGNDWFDMGDGNDHAIGGSGNDTFEGGNGNDILEGGAGNDTFSGTISQFNGDTINDFGSNDTLQFSGALLTSSNFTFSTSSSASASSSAALASSGQTSVAVDTNKDGTADASFVLKGSFNPALFTVSSTGASNTVMTYTGAASITSKSKIFMGAGGDSFAIASSGATVVGNTASDTITIASGITGIKTDANIERIGLSGNLADYTFGIVAGTGVQVLTSAGSVVATLPSLNQTTTLVFADGSAPLIQTGGSAFSLSGLAISTGTATALAATLNTADTFAPLPSSTLSKSKIFMGSGGDSFAITTSGASVVGNTGSDTITIADGITGIKTDANIERIELSQSLAGYKFGVVSGTGIQVQTTAGVVVATIPSLNQTTTLVFTDGSAPLIQTGGSAFSLGGLAISTAAAAAVAATLNSADKSSVGASGTASVGISGAGTSTDGGAAVATTYTISAGTYTHTIAGFGAGDILKLFTGATMTVSADSDNADGSQSVSLADAATGATTTITLTGLTSAQDAGLFNQGSFNTLFGAGTIA